MKDRQCEDVAMLPPRVGFSFTAERSDNIVKGKGGERYFLPFPIPSQFLSNYIVLISVAAYVYLTAG